METSALRYSHLIQISSEEFALTVKVMKRFKFGLVLAFFRLKVLDASKPTVEAW